MSPHDVPDWKAVHDDAVVLDLHAHPILKAFYFRRRLNKPPFVPAWLHRAMNPLSVRTSFDRLQAGGVDVLLSTAYPLERRLFDDIALFRLVPLRFIRFLPFTFARHIWREVYGQPYFEATLSLLKEMERQVDKYSQERRPGERDARMVGSRQELDEIVSQGPEAPIAVIHSVEGAHSLEGPIGFRHRKEAWEQLPSEVRQEIQKEVIENLEALFDQGVAYLIPAHFYPNRVVTPTFPFPEHLALGHVREKNLNRIWRDVDLTHGLTELGRDVVRRMVELGMLIDVTHATPKARQEIYALVEGLRSERPVVLATHVGAYEINPTPYNLEDWEIRWIAEHGGVVGVIFMNYWLMHYETSFGLNFISRTIEHFHQVGGDDVVAIGTDFDGAEPPDDIDDASELPRVTERLLAEYDGRGRPKYAPDQVKNFLGGNALRMLRAGWGK